MPQRAGLIPHIRSALLLSFRLPGLLSDWNRFDIMLANVQRCTCSKICKVSKPIHELLMSRVHLALCPRGVNLVSTVRLICLGSCHVSVIQMCYNCVTGDHLSLIFDINIIAAYTGTRCVCLLTMIGRYYFILQLLYRQSHFCKQMYTYTGL